jgi:hypothetical protein
MKKFILTSLLMLTFEASSFAGWFDHQREQQLEQQLQHEQDHSNTQGTIIFVLGVSCVIALIFGTMIGSKTRRAANDK